MAEKMKTLLDSLDQFIKVLALAQSVHAKDWDIQHVQRALDWGTYFQHVHHRFRTDNPVRSTIETQITERNKELSRYIENYNPIMFDDLHNGRDILCMSLLQNKALPDPTFKYVTELLRNADSKSGESTCSTHIISQKVVSELFLSLPLLAFEKLHELLDNPVLMTQADLLRSSLEKRLQLSEDRQKPSVVSEFLGQISKPRVYHLIEAILLSNEALDLLSDLLLDWVQSDDDHCVGFFMNVNCQVLARLSFMTSKFRNVYINHLVKLGSSMAQDVTCGKWVSDTFKLSFDGLLDHYKHLMEEPEDVKDFVLSNLRTLKSQDGNYDVSGISVWTDILAEIHKT
ncbi:Fanconi anemia group F protein [Eleutherodactylus coqui]|uniref:Fanconi anemia group F protein n=1 Tax=Eleutherodactylus coqui TaxID=57060 RepID=A0A8J6K3C5_ELECQ|nr:hypothetical protein GDO78_013247 [Eleutherodactylus coqui]